MVRRRHSWSMLLGAATIVLAISTASGQTVIGTTTRDNVVSPNGKIQGFTAHGAGGGIVLRNRATGATSLVIPAGPGPGSGVSSPSLSSDGRFLAFQSPELFNNTSITDILVRDRATGTIERVNDPRPPDVDPNNSSSSPKITPDGRFVVFDSFASNLVPNDTNARSDIFVRDRVAGTTTRVSVTNSGGAANGSSFLPAISADGRIIVFMSGAGNLDPRCDPGVTPRFHVYARNTVQGTTTCLDLAPDNVTAGNGHGFKPVVSADGCVVAFTSHATNLLPAGQDTNALPDVFARNLCESGGLVRASVGDGSPGAQAVGGGSDNPAISADGRFIAFDSKATNLVPGVPAGRRIYVRDLKTGTTTRIDDSGMTINFRPSISADGRVVVFDSTDTEHPQYEPGDFFTNCPSPGVCSIGTAVSDVVSAILAAGPTAILTAPAGPGSGVLTGFDATIRPTLVNRPPYPGFTGAIRLAVGDVDGDGAPDIITAPGPGGGPHVRVLVGSTADRVLLDFFAYSPSFLGGLFVAAGDVDGDGKAEVITAPGLGGGPHVRVWKFVEPGAPPLELTGFFAFGPTFTGGVSVAAGDIEGTGKAAIVTGAGPGGGPHVVVWRYVDGTVVPFSSFFAYDPGFLGGVNVAVGDLTGSGRAQVITGAGPGAGPHVKSFRFEADGTPVTQASFFAYVPGFSGGVNVAVADTTGSGEGQIVTGPGPGGGPHVRVIQRTQPPEPAPPPEGEIEVEVDKEFQAGPPDDTSGVNPGGDPPGGSGDAL